MSAACTRDSVEKCIARKISRSLSLYARQFLPHPFTTVPSSSCLQRSKRVHFPPMRSHPRRAGNVNISLLAPRASSPRVHVYNGRNCAKFQPLKCVGREKGQTGSREVRAGMHVSLVTLRSCSCNAMVVHTVGAHRLHTAMNADRIAIV